MSAGVVHRPRLAYDGARSIVLQIAHGELSLVAGVLTGKLGVTYGRLAEETWYRLAADPDRINSETGLWRARLDDLLTQRPELRDRLQETIAQLTA